MRWGLPPAGAVVFYEWGGYGHAAIAVDGGGNAVSTQGVDGSRLPVRSHRWDGISLKVLGWVMP